MAIGTTALIVLIVGIIVFLVFALAFACFIIYVCRNKKSNNNHFKTPLPLHNSRFNGPDLREPLPDYDNQTTTPYNQQPLDRRKHQRDHPIPANPYDRNPSEMSTTIGQYHSDNRYRDGPYSRTEDGDDGWVNYQTPFDEGPGYSREQDGYISNRPMAFDERPYGRTDIGNSPTHVRPDRRNAPHGELGNVSDWRNMARNITPDPGRERTSRENARDPRSVPNNYSNARPPNNGQRNLSRDMPHEFNYGHDRPYRESDQVMAKPHMPSKPIRY